MLVKTLGIMSSENTRKRFDRLPISDKIISSSYNRTIRFEMKLVERWKQTFSWIEIQNELHFNSL